MCYARQLNVDSGTSGDPSPSNVTVQTRPHGIITAITANPPSLGVIHDVSETITQLAVVSVALSTSITMSSSQMHDEKPTITVDGHDLYDVPVEEEELEVSPNMGQSKVWAMKVCILPPCREGFCVTLCTDS